MNNDIWGAFIAGIAFTAMIVGIFQIGINVGLKTSIDMLEEYPAAKNFLNKNKKIGHILPYVISGSND